MVLDLPNGDIWSSLSAHVPPLACVLSAAGSGR